jgi:hypothetical protein
MKRLSFTFETSLTPVYFVWALLLFDSGFSLFRLQWMSAFLSLVTFGLTLLPFFFERRFRLSQPNPILGAMVFFITATLFLGEASGFYDRFWWWDILLHAGSAAGFGLLGFVIMLYLTQSSKLVASPFLVSSFSFCFALAIGALWEIFEFTMDQTFGTNMQKSGLRDTMSDLIVDGGGALLASVGGYLYLRFGPRGIIGGLIHEFCRQNLPFFQKKLARLRNRSGRLRKRRKKEKTA